METRRNESSHRPKYANQQRIYNIEEYSQRRNPRNYAVKKEALLACGNTTNPRTEYFPTLPYYSVDDVVGIRLPIHFNYRESESTQSTIQHYSFHQRHTTTAKRVQLYGSFCFFLHFFTIHYYAQHGVMTRICKFPSSHSHTVRTCVPNELNSRRDLRFIIHTNNVVVCLRKSLGLNTNQPFRFTLPPVRPSKVRTTSQRFVGSLHHFATAIRKNMLWQMYTTNSTH